jgi:hypothetical protein
MVIRQWAANIARWYRLEIPKGLEWSGRGLAVNATTNEYRDAWHILSDRRYNAKSSKPCSSMCALQNVRSFYIK